MLSIDGIAQQTHDIDATFLEPAMGDGNFIEAILAKKLKTISATNNSWPTYALRALCSIYGIELLEDNLRDARARVLHFVMAEFESIFSTPCDPDSDFYRSASLIVELNLVQGNTLKKKNNAGQDIYFSQWERVKQSRSMVTRIPFSFSSCFEDDDAPSLFDLNPSTTSYKPCSYLHIWKEELA